MITKETTVAYFKELWSTKILHLSTLHVKCKIVFPQSLSLIVISFAWLLLNTYYLGISMQATAIPTARDVGRFFLRYECYRPPSPHCLEPLLTFMLDTCMTQFSALKGLVIESFLTLCALVFVKIITRHSPAFHAFYFNTFLSKPCTYS